MVRKRFCLLVLLILLSGLLNVYAHDDDDELFKPVEIKDGSSLSVMDCVASAFKNSPKIKRKKYNLDIAKSNVGIAKSQYFPVINAGVGFYNENNSNNIYYNSHYRELPSVAVSVNKLIWNFGKTTAYIKMEEFYKIGAEYEFIDSLCSTVFDIKGKYYNLLRASALKDIAEYNIEINKHFLELAKDKNKCDITTAKLNLSDANVKFIEAQNNYNNERVNLTNSMYLENQPDYSIKITKTFDYSSDYAKNPQEINSKDFKPEIFPFTREKALEIAYDNSPDLSVLTSTKQAMEQSLLYIKRMYFPDLTVNAGYGYNNANIYNGNNSLQVGVNLNSNVNLMELRHSIKGADAQVYLADNEILLFKKDLQYELKRAFNDFDRAEKQIPASKLEVGQAYDNLKIVEDLYIKDKLNYIALQDARKDYIHSLNNYIESLYNYNMALIEVEMAMHYHLVDIHHKSEHAVHYHSQELVEHLNKALGCDEWEVPKTKKGRKQTSSDL